jgi:hypothetical protein
MLPPAARCFDPRSRQSLELAETAAQLALAEHRLAIIDPAPALVEFLAICWSSLLLDHDAPRSEQRLVGPAVYFPTEAYTPPVLPIGGLSTAEVVAAYVDAAPVAANSSYLDRIPLRSYRDPPGLWRRSVPLPLGCQGAAGAERRQVFEAKARALPSAEYLSAWYRKLRADWWRRYAIHRFI